MGYILETTSHVAEAGIKEIEAIIDSANEEEAIRCTECGEIGVDRGDGVILCDECYDDITSVTERFYEDEEEEEEPVVEDEEEDRTPTCFKGDEEFPECDACSFLEECKGRVNETPAEEEEDSEEEPIVEEPVVEPEPEPVVEAPKPKPVPKKYIKITRNVAVERIPVGTLVTFKCKAGSNIRTFAGDMSVGLVLKKRSGIKTYSGNLTRKLKKDIKLKKIILLR